MESVTSEGETLFSQTNKKLQIEYCEENISRF